MQSLSPALSPALNRGVCRIPLQNVVRFLGVKSSPFPHTPLPRQRSRSGRSHALSRLASKHRPDTLTVTRSPSCVAPFSAFRSLFGSFSVPFRLARWPARWPASQLAGWLAGRLAGWLAGWLAGLLAACVSPCFLRSLVAGFDLFSDRARYNVHPRLTAILANHLSKQSNPGLQGYQENNQNLGQHNQFSTNNNQTWVENI